MEDLGRGSTGARSGGGPALVAWGALVLLGCGGPGVEDPGAASRPDAEVRLGDFERELLLTGELQAVRSIAIKAPQTSMFQMRIQFMAEEGSLVRRGDPLLDFDNSALVDQARDLETRILDAETQIVTKRNELASALKDLEIELAEKEYEAGRAELDAAVDPEVLSRKEHGERQLAWTKAVRELEETHERMRLTRERGQAELDVLIIDRDKLKKDLLVAREGVDRLAIRAPADGLVVYESRPGSTLRFQEGDSCWPGQGVMSLPDLSQMQVSFFVNEVDAPLLRPGMPLRITLDSFPGRELAGAIVTVPSMAVKRDDSSRVPIFKVVASLAETWVGEMKPGMSTLGRVVVERLRDVPLVRRHAVRFDGEGYRLAGTDGRAAGPRIRPVARNERFYVLSDGDRALAAAAGERPGAVVLGEES